MVVVVLGNRLRSEEIHSRLRGRVDLGIELFRQAGDGPIVLSGGRTNTAVSRTEADVMREYAIERGVDPELVETETKAKDTVGNAYFTRKLLADLDHDFDIRIATSCYHTARAVFAFEHCFGDRYEVSTPDCYRSKLPSSAISEGESMKLNREFFAGISPGDTETVRDRLVSDHDLYSEADFAEPDPDT